MTSQERLLTATEAANYLHLSLHHVYRLIRGGELPAVHFGRQLRLDPSALRDFIARGGTAVAAPTLGALGDEA